MPETLGCNVASVYELRVGEGDLGKIIGKRGRALKALRTILEIQE